MLRANILSTPISKLFILYTTIKLLQERLHTLILADMKLNLIKPLKKHVIRHIGFKPQP